MHRLEPPTLEGGGEDERRGHASWFQWAGPALAVALPVLAYAVHVLLNSGQVPLLGGDQALLEMWTRSAAGGDALLGPYSRFEWNHPGPSVFYLWAPLYQLMGERPGALALGSVLVVGAASMGVVLVVRRSSGAIAGWVAAAVVLAFFVAAGPDWFDETWNPVLIIGPVMLLGVATAALAAGRRGALVVVVVSASFAVQTHFATAPVVGVFSLVAGFVVVQGLRRGSQRWRRPLAAAGACAAALWALPAYEQLTDRPGNVVRLVWSTGASSGGHSLGEVLDVMVVQLTLGGRGLVQQMLRSPDTVAGVSLWRSVHLVLLLGAVLALAEMSRRRGRRFEATLGATSVASAVVLVVALTRVEGAIEGYLTLSALALGFLLHLTVALASLRMLAQTNAIRRWRASHPTFPAHAVAAVLVLSSGAVTAAAVAASRPEYLYTDRPSETSPEVIDAVEAALPQDNSTVLMVIGAYGSWPRSTLVANQLERRGIRVAATPDWEFMFGDQRHADGCEGSIVWIGPPPSQPDLAVAAGRIAGDVVAVQDLEPPPGCRR